MTDRPLRILMVSDEWRPYIGGAGLCMELFARELARRGHTLAVATAWHREAPAFEADGELQVQRIRDTSSRLPWVAADPRRHTPPPFPDPEAIWRLRRLVARFRPDLIPAYGWIAHSLAAALLGRRVPMVLWGHDYGNICAMRSLHRLEREICSGPAPAKCLACSTQGRGLAKGPLAAASVLGAAPLLRRKTSALHGVSRYVTAALARELGVPGAPAVTIPNFHAERDGGAPDPAVLARLPDEPYVLFVGALRRVKGVEELLEAHRALEDPPPLVMVGIRTPDTPALPPGVTVLEDVPHATVMAMWERALFGVFPSKWPEPLATVVHEAMSRGRPVIATRPGGHEDMVEDGESGLVVPAGDPRALAAAMRRLLGDGALRERMGAVAQQRSRRFTRDAVVPRLERFYRETVERHGRAA